MNRKNIIIFLLLFIFTFVSCAQETDSSTENNAATGGATNVGTIVEAPTPSNLVNVDLKFYVDKDSETISTIGMKDEDKYERIYFTPHLYHGIIAAVYLNECIENGLPVLCSDASEEATVNHYPLYESDGNYVFLDFNKSKTDFPEKLNSVPANINISAVNIVFARLGQFFPKNVQVDAEIIDKKIQGTPFGICMLNRRVVDISLIHRYCNVKADYGDLIFDLEAVKSFGFFDMRNSTLIDLLVTYIRPKNYAPFNMPLDIAYRYLINPHQIYKDKYKGHFKPVFQLAEIVNIKEDTTIALKFNSKDSSSFVDGANYQKHGFESLCNDSDDLTHCKNQTDVMSRDGVFNPVVDGMLMADLVGSVEGVVIQSSKD